jgi:hypothetical protein
MIEPDILASEIESHKARQREAWRELASPALTTFDRREIRNRIRQSEAELRLNLEKLSDRLRFQPKPVQEIGNCLANIEFRILGGQN